LRFALSFALCSFLCALLFPLRFALSFALCAFLCAFLFYVIDRAKAAAFNVEEKRYIFCYDVTMRNTAVGASLEFKEFEPGSAKSWD
jgi:hypothetical protein